MLGGSRIEQLQIDAFYARIPPTDCFFMRGETQHFAGVTKSRCQVNGIANACERNLGSE